MPLILPQTQTTDQYTPGQGGFIFPVSESGGVPYVSGYVVVTPVDPNTPTTGVFLSVLVGPNQGSAYWQEEIPVPPGVLPISMNTSANEPDYIYGVRARNLVAGTNAICYGALYSPGEIAIVPQAGGGLGAPFEESCHCQEVGVIVETLYLSSLQSSEIFSSTVLQSGRKYIITVQGTYSFYNQALPVGSPQSDAMFPTSTIGRTSLQVGVDAETVFATPPGSPANPIGHVNVFQIDLGSGLTHIEPVGGPFSTPQPNFFYTYNVTGQGSHVGFYIVDTPHTDNYGKLLITIQTVGGNSGGGGTGSLLPDPSLEPDGSWLRTLSGAAEWQTTPPVTSFNSRTGDVLPKNADYAGILASFLSGSLNSTRLVGATSSGPPPSGTYVVGDLAVAQDGHIFICTTSGTPGIWTDVGTSGSLVTSVFGRTGAIVAVSGDYTAAQITNAADKSSVSVQTFTGNIQAPKVGGTLTGVSAANLAGGTASGSPVSGTFQIGDFIVTQDGHIFVCTASGTPGTWIDVTATKAATISTPSNPTGTGTTAKMMGLKGAITPTATGRVQLTICGDIFNSTAIGDGGQIRLRFGTGTAPNNGDAATGTGVGASVQYIAATIAEKAPFSITGLITGLTLGTAIWLDVSLAALTAGTATIENVTVTAVEI